MLLLTPGVFADVLRVDALSLSPDIAWRRGAAMQEQEDDIYLLEWPIPQGVALQVAVPRHATPLKTDAEGFHANLRRKWAAQYGQAGEIREVKIDSVRWLGCRRPAGDGSTVLFQFATVFEGRAYSLLVFAPPQSHDLPKPVHDLLAGARFGAEPRKWINTRVITARPGREALDALLLVDAERLGQAGMITGYGLEYPGEGQLAWFLEGFTWQRAGEHDIRVPFNLRGHLHASADKAVAGELGVNLRLSQAEGVATPLEAAVAALDVCAPRAAVADALRRLERGARAPLERLARERPSACPAIPIPSPAQILGTRPGQTTEGVLLAGTLPPPDAASLERLKQAGLTWLRVLAITPRLGATGEIGVDTPGRGLLRQAGLYFVYAPE